MGKKPNITIIGPGRLGSALAVSLKQAGYHIGEIVSRDAGALFKPAFGLSGVKTQSVRRARLLSRKLGARATGLSKALLESDVIWLCVTDSAIRECAEQLAARKDVDWKRKIVFHASGALSSDELEPLQKRGAKVGSVHPMMSFVHAANPSLAGVTFALEGDGAAVRAARSIVRDLQGESIAIGKANKSLYHAWGAFSSPLIVAELAAADLIARRLGLTPQKARKTLAPILRQTIENYIAHGPAAAFSGPLVRGDVDTVKRHIAELRQVPEARAVYLTLARTAVTQLPVGRREEMKKQLRVKSL